MSYNLPPNRVTSDVSASQSSASGRRDSTLSGMTSAPRIDQRLLPILKVGWIIIALLSLYAFYVGQAQRFIDLDLTSADMIAAQNTGLPALTPVYIIIAIETTMMTVFTGVAGLLFWRRGNDWVALETGMMLILTAFLYTGLRYKQVNLTMMIIIGLNAAAETAQVSFLFIFPNGRVMPRWWRYAFPFFFLFRLLIWLHQLPNNLPQEAWEIGIVVALLLIGFGYQIHRYRRIATPIQRQQQKWLLVGVALILAVVAPLVFVVSVFQWVTPQSNYTLYAFLIIVRQIALTALPISLAFSILRYRLWDIDVTIHRSIVSISIITILAVLFGGGFVVINAILTAIFRSSPEIALVLSGVAMGIAFNPTRKRVQNFVDRRFYRFRFNLLELRRANQVIIINPSAQSGDKVGGYAITSVIGKGGMGEVYRGQTSAHVAAIKMLSREGLNSDVLRRRLEREAEALKRLDHPNIVKLYAADFVNARPYIALEFIDGIDLSAYLKQHGALPLDETCRIVQKIADALAFCHQLGFVHRDLKPSNVMLRSVGGGQTFEPVLMDFGLAKLSEAATDLTGTGAIGSISYMAPEQIQDAHEVDHRADIYAFGAVVYEMLTGQCLFLGTPPQILFAQISQPPPDPRAIRPDLPLQMVIALKRALEKDPDSRYQSATEFASNFVLS